MAKDKKAIFSPKTQEVKPVDQKYSQEEVQAAQAVVEQEEKDKKVTQFSSSVLKNYSISTAEKFGK